MNSRQIKIVLRIHCLKLHSIFESASMVRNSDHKIELSDLNRGQIHMSAIHFLLTQVLLDLKKLAHQNYVRQFQKFRKICNFVVALELSPLLRNELPELENFSSPKPNKNFF